MNAPEPIRLTNCHLSGTPHGPHVWVREWADEMRPYTEDYAEPLVRRQDTQVCKGQPLQAPLQSVLHWMNELDKAKKVWTPAWFKVHDTETMRALMRLVNRLDGLATELRPGWLPPYPGHALTGTPVLIDEAIPSGLLVFVDENEKLVVLDIRKHMAPESEERTD